MKKLMFFCIIIILIAKVANADPKQISECVAVSEFEVRTQNVENAEFVDAKSIRETIATTLAHGQTLPVVERGQVTALLDETWLADTGFVNPDTAAEVGKATGAKWVVVGSFSIAKEVITVNARLVNVKSTKIIQGWSEQWKKTDNLAQKTRELGEEIVKAFKIPSAFAAAGKSLLFPGWGQLSNDRKSGFLFMPLCLGAVSAVGWMQFDYMEAKDEFDSEKTLSRREELKENIEDKETLIDTFLA